ncbi:winged helix-turn-helix transcriptional regulator [Aestuariibius sp. HNIBRBA575]|uniref:winged helix-turn-helix transcriptional regulator n=1 Tax=Aestuariibius sp. HNIBRBA575 TaxID=3233343 RepID=UPI0034A0E0AE
MSNSESLRTRAPIDTDTCGLARASEVLGDRWVLLILRELFYNVGRFEDIRAEIPVPKSVLSTRLARLIEQGLVEKRPYKPEAGRERMAYHLTEMGLDLAHTFLALLEWGNRHLVDGVQIAAKDKHSKRKLRVAMIDETTGAEAPIYNVRLRVDDDSIPD